MQSFHTIFAVATAHPYLVYAILFIVAIFQGPLLAIALGFLVRLGYIDIFGAYIVLVAGDFVPDTACFYIGKWGRNKAWIERLLVKFSSKNILEKLWKNHFRKMIFFSKEAYALSTPLLISAGLADIPYGRFISYAFPITLVQYIIFMSLGYFLGYSYGTAGNYINYAGWVVAIITIIFITAYVIFQKKARVSFTNMEKTENIEGGAASNNSSNGLK